MAKRHYLLAIVITCTVGVAYGAGDPVAGKEKAAPCTSCHGVDGNSKQTAYPKLAGQLASYIVKQTVDFQEGRRKDNIMSGMVSMVTNREDLEDIAAYFASQPTMKGKHTSSPIAKKGKRLIFEERCVFCHDEGAKPGGPYITDTPVIGGQHKEYLIKAMKDIKSAKRKADIYGLMYKTLNRLSDEDIAAIAEYLSSL